MDKKNLSIVRQSFANTVFTHKVQEVAAEKQERNAFYVKIVNVLLVTIVLILLFLQASSPTNILYSYIAAGVTITEIVFLIVQIYFGFEQRAVVHKNSALKYMELRDNYRSLIVDIMNESVDVKALIEKREFLQNEYQVISDLSPQTGNEECIEAQKRLNKRGIVEGEEFTWSDEEIDRFLPEKLRFNKKK